MSIVDRPTHPLSEIFNLWLLEREVLELLFDALCLALLDLYLFRFNLLLSKCIQHARFLARTQQNKCMSLALVPRSSSNPVDICICVLGSVNLENPVHSGGNRALLLRDPWRKARRAWTL